MFDIAWSEFLVVAVVALVVVGPKDLPALLRTVGKTVASLRRMAGEFQGQFNEAMREAELDDLKKDVTGMKDAASRMVGGSPFQIARDELKRAIETTKPAAPSALAGEAPDAAAAEQTPSALAPQPDIAPVDEPPPPTEAELQRRAARVAARREAARAQTPPSVASRPNGADTPQAGQAPSESAADGPASPSKPGAAA